MAPSSPSICADPQNGNRDIWYTEIARGTTARLTTDAANDWFPAWSPDSKQIAFTSDRAGPKSGAGGYLFIKKSMDPGRDELAPADRRRERCL